jgi:hypothetical protein
MLLIAGLAIASTAALAQAPIGKTWTDRRPMGRLFMSQTQFVTPVNPDGYLNHDVDISTPAGRQAFKKLLLDSADRWIAIMKAANVQGVIVWDIEGAQQAGMMYVGDPRVLPVYAPEMDAVARDFFKKFRDAGLRTGVTIRPNNVHLNPPDQVARWGKWGYTLRRKSEVVRELGSMMDYAQKHWGCTIFYMDSNYYADDNSVDGFNPSHEVSADMLDQLHAQHPGCLIIPEHPDPDYWRSGAQYYDGYYGWGTTDAERRQYPGAFSVMALTGEKAFPKWDMLAHEVQYGDVLLIDGWYESGANTVVKYLYQQAAYQKAALPAGTDTNSAPALLNLLQGHDQAVRFLAVRALGSLSDTTQGDALTAIAASDADWVVQKEAVVALGRLKHAAAVPVLQKLTSDPYLGYFATAALHDIQAP